MTPLRALIFTDLDGTLIGHYDYSAEPARPLLQRLLARDIPVIPCTSKTRAELLSWRAQMGLGEGLPFIVENGAGIFLPQAFLHGLHYDSEVAQQCGLSLQGDYWLKILEDEPRWRVLFDQVGQRFKDYFETFNELDDQAVATLCGFDLADARAARQRDFAEVIVWRGGTDCKQEFISALQELGLSVVQGGRFLHVTGGADKGKALTWLVEFIASAPLQHAIGSPLVIAAGDGQNDLPMLNAADWALLIPSPVNPLPVLTKVKQVVVAAAEGPVGWDQGIREICFETGLL